MLRERGKCVFHEFVISEPGSSKKPVTNFGQWLQQTVAKKVRENIGWNKSEQFIKTVFNPFSVTKQDLSNHILLFWSVC